MLCGSCIIPTEKMHVWVCAHDIALYLFPHLGILQERQNCIKLCDKP